MSPQRFFFKAIYKLRRAIEEYLLDLNTDVTKTKKKCKSDES
jgi:hypothetical protein